LFSLFKKIFLQHLLLNSIFYERWPRASWRWAHARWRCYPRNGTLERRAFSSGASACHGAGGSSTLQYDFECNTVKNKALWLCINPSCIVGVVFLGLEAYSNSLWTLGLFLFTSNAQIWGLCFLFWTSRRSLYALRLVVLNMFMKCICS